MDPATEALLTAKIKGLLLLNKSEAVTRNVLAILGLFSIDFADAQTLQVLCDADGVTVRDKSFQCACTCQSSHDPKVVRVGDDFHASVCHRAMEQRLAQDPNLVDADIDPSGTIWTFQWPRDIEPNRNVIAECFTELKQEALWKNFRRAWSELVALMPDDPRPQVADVEVAQDQDADPGFDFDIPDTPETTEREQIVQDTVDFIAANLLSCPPHMHPEEADTVIQASASPMPQEPTTDEKRGRGRPKGSTKSAKEQALEPSASDFVAQGEAKKTIPACVKFANILRDEMSRLSSEAEFIRGCEEFPLESIRSIKTSLDRLALRAAHMEFRGAHDADDPHAINPLVEVTLANVTAVLNGAVRDLGLAPEVPKTWEEFCRNIKEARDVADDMHGIMSQMGAGAAIQEPPTPQG
jgi:hypothetical protein